MQELPLRRLQTSGGLNQVRRESHWRQEKVAGMVALKTSNHFLTQTPPTTPPHPKKTLEPERNTLDDNTKAFENSQKG